MRDHLPPAWPVQALGPLDHPAIRDMAEAILADAPPTFALCGHSLGGYVCFELIRRAPERVRADPTRARARASARPGQHLRPPGHPRAAAGAPGRHPTGAAR